MGAELLRRAAEELRRLNDDPEAWSRPILGQVASLLEVYAYQERHTEAEDSSVDAAIHDLAEEILK